MKRRRKTTNRPPATRGAREGAPQHHSGCVVSPELRFLFFLCVGVKRKLWGWEVVAFVWRGLPPDLLPLVLLYTGGAVVPWWGCSASKIVKNFCAPFRGRPTTMDMDVGSTETTIKSVPGVHRFLTLCERW